MCLSNVTLLCLLRNGVPLSFMSSCCDSSNDNMNSHYLPTNRSICYKSYDLHHTSFLNSHLVGAVTSNVTGLSALAADRLLRAVAGNVTGLSAITAHGSVGAVASDVTGLAAVVAHSLVGALAGNVSELSAVAAHDVLVAGTLLSIGAVTSLVAHLAAVVALGLSLRLLSGLYSLNSKRLHYC